MKSFEAEMVGVGAADAKAAERKYIEEKAGGLTGEERQVLNAINVPDFGLESSTDEAQRIARTQERTTGSLKDLQVNEAELQRQGITAGVNPERAERDTTPAKEYFAKGEENPLIESDTLAEMRLKNPALAERYVNLTREHVSRKADIMNLEQQIASQKDEKLRAAQMKVLAQFQRELVTLQKELDDLSQNF